MIIVKEKKVYERCWSSVEPGFQHPHTLRSMQNFPELRKQFRYGTLLFFQFILKSIKITHPRYTTLSLPPLFFFFFFIYFFLLFLYSDWETPHFALTTARAGEIQGALASAQLARLPSMLSHTLSLKNQLVDLLQLSVPKCYHIQQVRSGGGEEGRGKREGWRDGDREREGVRVILIV